MITLCEVLNTVQWQYNTWHPLVIHWLCLLSCALASLSTASLLARLRPDNSPLFSWPYQSTRGLVFRCSPSLRRTTFGASHLRGSFYLAEHCFTVSVTPSVIFSLLFPPPLYPSSFLSGGLGGPHQERDGRGLAFLDAALLCKRVVVILFVPRILWNTSWEGSAGVRYLRTSCWRIRNRTSERSELMTFVIEKRVRRYRAKHFPCSIVFILCILRHSSF